MSGNRRLRIGIDCRTLRPPAADGIATYARLVTQAIGEQADVEISVFCFAEAVPFLPEAVRDRVVMCSGWRIPVVSAHLFDAWLMRRALIDVLFVPGGHQPLFSFTPAVVVVHDILIFDHPEWFPKQLFAPWLTMLSLRKAKHLIAVSKNTAQSLVRIAGDRVRVTVVYPGPPIVLSSGNASTVQPRPYALILGTLEPRKNILFAVRAFLEASRTMSHPLDLVIAGRQGWRSEVIEEELVNVATQTRGTIRWVGPVSDLDKASLLTNAHMLLFPSLDEGFGLPPAEAQVVGVPVIASDIAILRETAGDGALFVDPTNTNAWSSAILRVASDHTLREQLVVRGKQNAARYDWQRTAREVIRICRTATKAGSDTHL